MSRSELRRLIRSGAVRINTHKETDELAMINPESGMLLWLGKHNRFIVRLVLISILIIGFSVKR
ncbi:hypothetical protein [Pectobacterium carotovorum]|nr:hypothetical protein [Pectobacterium carotovorum]GKW39465.1 hypothetical protein PEC301875_34890 [Pectobacterium carotovorum subsp. carotovorum]